MTHCFDTDIAKEYGILEAVIINHFVFWISKNKANQVNFHDGDYWTYNSTVAFQELFPYASKRQIERALQHLRDEDIIKVGNYNELKYDRTLWYAFTEKGKCISRFGEMDITKKGNGYNQTVTPIPDNNTDNNSDTDADNIPPTPKGEKRENSFDYELFRGIYNSTCTNLASCRKITDKRKKAIKAFFKEYGLDDWKEVCGKANMSPFLTGDNDTGWEADIDFLLRVDKASKILEGGYQASGKKEQPEQKKETAEDRWGHIGIVL